MPNIGDIFAGIGGIVLVFLVGMLILNMALKILFGGKK